MQHCSRIFYALVAIALVSCVPFRPALGFIIDPEADYWLSTASGLRSGNGVAVTLTWSFVRDGTSVIDSNDFGNLGNSDLIGSLDAAFGDNTSSLNLTGRSWFPHFESAFARWEELSGATYIYEPNDDGALAGSGSPNGVLNVRGDLRIAGASIDSSDGVLAFNYFPGNGDMVLDTDDIPGTFSQSANNYQNFRNIVMHEHGHGLGLSHVVSTSDELLLEPSLNTGIDGPQLDDVRAIQYYFGDANEKTNGGNGNNSANDATHLGNLTDLGSMGVGSDADVPDQSIGPTATDFVSLANLSDTDFYSFEVDDSALLSATLTPRGGQFNQGPQGTSPSLFDASARVDLMLTIFAADGTTILETANTTGKGGVESIVDLQLPAAGEYFARISGADDTIQLYELELELKSNLVTLEADFNSDGDVDQADLSIWQTAYDSSNLGDADGDSDTDGFDFLVWQRQFTGSPGSIAAVPEPSAGVLLAMGYLWLSARRCREA